MRSLVAGVIMIAGLGGPFTIGAQQPFMAGEPLDLMPNTRVFGSFHFAES